MKKAATLLFFLIIWVHDIHPQVIPNSVSLGKTSKEISSDYLQKTQQQKTVGIILLVGGVGVASIGASTMELDGPGANAFFYLGNFVVLGSVPFFISAARNKDRAELVLRKEPISIAAVSGKRITSVGVNIPLNK